MKLGSDLSAVVVGGASGLGEAVVRALRAYEVRVAILDLDEDKGRALAKETGALFFQADATDEQSLVHAFDAARQVQGQERALVATTGGGTPSATVWRDAQTGEIRRLSHVQFSRSVVLNLHSAFLSASVAAAGMMSLPLSAEGDRGAIIMTSSTTSQDGPSGAAAYVAGKAGINGLTLSMARDLGGEAIRVNAILPGIFDTPLLASVPEDYKAGMRDWNVHPKRFGRPAEYASLALQLIENGYFNGALLRLDGGAHV